MQTKTLNPDRKIIVITLLSAFLLITFFSTLFLLPPIGTIIGLLLDFLVLTIAAYILTSKLEISTDTISKRTIMHKQEIEVSSIVSIKNVRVLGTVSQNPFMVRQITFEVEDGQLVHLNTMLFPYESVLDLIEIVTDSLENQD